MSYMQQCGPVCPCRTCRRERIALWQQRQDWRALGRELRVMFVAALVCIFAIWATGCSSPPPARHLTKMGATTYLLEFDVDSSLYFCRAATCDRVGTRVPPSVPQP